jgi:integrase
MTKRRIKMWIENGRLYDRYTGADGKTHKVSVPLTKDTPQARRNARNALDEKIADILSRRTKKTLSELITIYLEQKDVKASSLSNYENAFNQILKILGDVYASDLTAPYIRQKFLEADKPVSTKNRYTHLLNTFLKWLFEYGYMDNLIRISSLKEKQIKKDPGDLYLEADELRQVLDQLSGSMHGYICHFMALTGCRIGEAVALTLEDITDRYIEITKTYDKINNIINTPKSVTSEREIFIQAELRSLLKEYLDWRRLYMMAHGIRTDLLFFSMTGGYYSGAKLRDRLHKIDPKLHPHIFRHTHVALLAEQGASLETISRRLGHADSGVTKEVYFHVTKKMKEKDEQLLERISFL